MRGGTYSEGTGAPGGSTANLGEISEDGEGVLVSERNKDETVVSEGAHGGDGSRLLASSHGSSGDEHTDVLARESTLAPESAGGVDERLELSREVSVTGGDAEEDTIVVAKGVGGSDGIVPLGSGVHLGEDLVGESLGNPEGPSATRSQHNVGGGRSILEEVDLSTTSLDTLLLGLSESGNVAVHGVDDDSDLGHCWCCSGLVALRGSGSGQVVWRTEEEIDVDVDVDAVLRTRIGRVSAEEGQFYISHAGLAVLLHRHAPLAVRLDDAYLSEEVEIEVGLFPSRRSYPEPEWGTD